MDTVTKFCVSHEQQCAKSRGGAKYHRALYIEEVCEQHGVVVTHVANSSTPKVVNDSREVPKGYR
jgi:hypothetical protein